MDATTKSFASRKNHDDAIPERIVSNEMEAHIVTTTFGYKLINYSTMIPNFMQSPLQIEIQQSPFAKYYPAQWDYDMPFHEGEIFVQRKLGTHDDVMQFAPKFIRPYLPEQHVDFYTNQPYLAVAARDTQGRMWASLMFGKEPNALFVSSPDPTTLVMDHHPIPGDVLRFTQTPQDVGLMGLEFQSRRRNRVNGIITPLLHDGTTTLHFSVSQSFGNCPQYIRPREWWWEPTTTTTTMTEYDETHLQKELTRKQQAWIAKADTLFLATGYRPESANPYDVRYGNDVSHRGGRAGFLLVDDATTLILPDFPGNNMYNSLGNIHSDPRVGLAIVDFETGSLLQISGRAEIDFDTERAARLIPGAVRLVTIKIDAVNSLPPGSLPLRWSESTSKDQQRELTLTRKEQETPDITSFYFEAPLNDGMKRLWDYSGGQHIPIALKHKETGQVLERTYSLSQAPQNLTSYRISVKRVASGHVSNYIHDHLNVGDSIVVNKPTGDFHLAETTKTPVVLISIGVGITPVLAILHEAAKRSTPVVWIHGTQSHTTEAFRTEVDEAVSNDAARIKSYTVYSREDASSTCSLGSVTTELYNRHIDASLVAQLLEESNVDTANANYYLCGKPAFAADIEQDLVGKWGVSSRNIHSETF